MLDKFSNFLKVTSFNTSTKLSPLYSEILEICPTLLMSDTLIVKFADVVSGSTLTEIDGTLLPVVTVISVSKYLVPSPSFKS